MEDIPHSQLVKEIQPKLNQSNLHSHVPAPQSYDDKNTRLVLLGLTPTRGK